MEFLRSLLRRRFARCQVLVATSRNVGCFLRLGGGGEASFYVEMFLLVINTDEHENERRFTKPRFSW